jgi:hypothetical protein
VATWKIKGSVGPDDLGDEIEELRIAWDDMSARWQESDKGQQVSDWLDRLEEIVSAYADVLTDLDENREPSE